MMVVRRVISNSDLNNTVIKTTQIGARQVNTDTGSC